MSTTRIKSKVAQEDIKGMAIACSFNALNEFDKFLKENKFNADKYHMKYERYDLREALEKIIERSINDALSKERVIQNILCMAGSMKS